MTLLDKLERRFGSLAIANIAAYIVVGQIAIWLLDAFAQGPDGRSPLLGLMIFDSQLVLKGEIWRIFTFPFIPPPVRSPLFLFFAWYIFYFITGALESQWGAFRVNVYLLLGAGLGMLSGLIMPGFPITNFVWGQTVFLAFAHLFPNFEFRLFFVLPVKVRWLGWLAWAGLFLSFLAPYWQSKVFIAASVSNYFIFFGRDILFNIKSKKRLAEMKAEKAKVETEAFHSCSVCNATDKSHPQRDFRYRDDTCICEDCLSQERNGSDS